jgi:hypothetical protein
MRRLAWLVMWLAVPSRVVAQDSARTVTVGGFVDTYYAWDFNASRPGAFDRAYTTQAVRNEEFNVNLAFVEVKLSGPQVRGRLALQAGTSVQANYAGEPTTGAVSGPDLARHIQEAVVGVRAARTLWIDAGIYLSHIGQESWISRDNPTYSRSMIAEFSPYYEAGMKATWAASAKLTAQLHVLNGWQNIAETNQDKAVGMRLDYAVSPHLSVGYDNFIGNEAPDTAASRLRVFNEVLASMTSGRFQAWLTLDYGVQSRRPASGTSHWYGGAAIARLGLSGTVAVSARVEHYADPDGVIVATGTASGFRVSGGSIGVDVTPAAGVVWRSEVRGFMARDAVFPLRGTAGIGKRDAFVVSSLALTF